MTGGEKSFIEKGNHFHRYLEYASAVLIKYKGEEPFHRYLKKYFSSNKKHGSRDRKIITSLCYNYFRLGFGVISPIAATERLLLGIFLAENKSSLLPKLLKPELKEKIDLELSEKTELLKKVFNAEEIFPFKDELSNEIDFHKFSLSFLVQPKLFIRIRPGNRNAVFDKLKSANILFEEVNNTCLSFSNTEKITELISIDKEAVIQDCNSQRTGDLLTSYIKHPTSNISVWDCCAASGGKSILAYDLFKNIELTVSDIRTNILENLKGRFMKAGIKNYNSFVCDLSVSFPSKQPNLNPDIIIADVPCSGSGTWARSPEQLHFFSKKSIEKYVILQQNIVQHASGVLKPGGYFLYITCSVFKKENEENVAFIEKKLQLHLIKAGYLKGYEIHADTLFAALFQKK